MENAARSIEARQPVRQENETLLTLAKALDKFSPRNYGTVIGIIDGKAYVTDGFALLRWIPNGHLGENRVIRPDLSESPVKYPGVSAVLPTDVGEEIPAEAFNSMRKFLKASWAKSPVFLRVLNDEVSLMPSVLDGKDNQTLSGHLFNPYLFMKFCKGLHKHAGCTKATLHNGGETLKLTFDSPVGQYELILVGMRKDV